MECTAHDIRMARATLCGARLDSIRLTAIRQAGPVRFQEFAIQVRGTATNEHRKDLKQAFEVGSEVVVHLREEDGSGCDYCSFMTAYDESRLATPFDEVGIVRFSAHLRVNSMREVN